MEKPRILLCWAYHRRHFVNVFNKLAADFDFIYLNWFNKDIELEPYGEVKAIYWLDFKNIQQLVKEVKPDKVVFMGMEGLATILNEYCKKRKIPTYFLQHGVFHSYNAYVQEELLERKKINSSGEKKEFKSVKRSLILKFLASSFSFELINSYYIVARVAILTKLFHSRQRAFNLSKSSTRKASKYIVFTKYCSVLLADRDGIADEDFIEIGNPEADEILSQMENESVPLIAEQYFLLIDDPVADAQDTNGLFSVETVREFHSKLNAYALDRGKKLLIKLHPDNYGSQWLYKHDNIIYMRNSNIANLIKYAAGIFGGSSTLLTPALQTKPACLFKYNDDYLFQKFVSANDYCTVLNFFHFRVSDIVFKNDLTAQQKEAYTKAFLFCNDMGSLQRIHKVLKSSTE